MMRLGQVFSLALGVILAAQAIWAVAVDDPVGSMIRLEKQQQQQAMDAAAITNRIAKESTFVPIIAAPESLEEQEQTELEKSLSKGLGPVSLEEQIVSQRVMTEIELFGHDGFMVPDSTYRSNTPVSVPDDYIIGPGDTFKIQVFGVSNFVYELVTTREGDLLVPEVGALHVAGLTLSEAKDLVSEAFASLRVGVKTVVTLGDIKNIQVMIVGEVIRPGSYTVSGFSTLINTLYNTGGLKKTGSLRNITLKRGGITVSVLDLYDFLLHGDTSKDAYLKQGDVIFIPPIGKTVGVAGQVNRPAIYELKNETEVLQAIGLAGGLLPSAARNKIQIERINGGAGYTLVEVDLEGQGSRVRVTNGDLIRVTAVSEMMDSVVLLAGNVLNPGGYQWSQGMRVADLVGGPDNLRQGTDMSLALIERENRQSKRTEIEYVELNSVLSDPSSKDNKLLSSRDRVYIFSTHAVREETLAPLLTKLRKEESAAYPAPIAEINGFVRHPGSYPLNRDTTLLDLLNYSGGMQVGTDPSYVIVSRRDALTKKVELIHIDLGKALQNGQSDHNPIIVPYDRIYIFGYETDRAKLLQPEVAQLRNQATYGDITPVVTVRGKVKSPGSYPQTAGMKVKDLITASGGLSEDAFGDFATVARRVLLDGQYTYVDKFKVKLTETGGLERDLNTILHPYDEIEFLQKPEWVNRSKRVTIEGQVAFPGSYTVDKRETLCGLVRQAGGLTEDAYLFGTVFLRESIRQSEQKALDQLIDEMDQLLAEVQLSPGFEKDRKQPVAQQDSDTYEIIKNLKAKRASGRLVIDMAAAVKSCQENSDIVLEDGDRIIIPTFKDEVSVVGQVYFPTSHQYRSDRAALDYINLSGGTKELAQREHAYVVQANGEVMTLRSAVSTWGWLSSPSNIEVTPGSTIYVPLSVDRINGRELAISWVDLFYKLTLGAASVDFLFK